MALPDLTDLDRVKAYLRSEVGGNGEEVLEGFIATASRRIRRHTGRYFTSPRAVGATREFRTRDMGRVYVDEVFAESDITKVTDGYDIEIPYELDWDGEPERMGAWLLPLSLEARFGIKGLPEDHGTNFIRNLPFDYASTLPNIVRVTGTFGYGNADIPEEIQFECVRCVATWWKEEVAHYSDDAFISRGRVFPPDELPPIVISGLSGWVVRDEVTV